MHSGGTNMTFTPNDIHDFYNKDQQSKQDHDSHQQLSYTISICQQHPDQQPVYVHHQFPSYDNLNIINEL